MAAQFEILGFRFYDSARRQKAGGRRQEAEKRIKLYFDIFLIIFR